MGDISKQVGKNLRDKRVEADQNVRRYAQNYPMVERSVDSFAMKDPFNLNFNIRDKNRHPTKLDISILELPPKPITGPVDMLIQADCACPIYDPSGNSGSWLGGGGLPGEGFYPATYSGFNVNIGGFQMASGGGIIVPIEGYYFIEMYQNSVGVTLGNPYIRAAITADGVEVGSAGYTVGNGFNAGFVDCQVHVAGVAHVKAGGVVTAWCGAGDIAFFIAYDFCNWWGGSALHVVLLSTT